MDFKHTTFHEDLNSTRLALPLTSVCIKVEIGGGLRAIDKQAKRGSEAKVRFVSPPRAQRQRPISRCFRTTSSENGGLIHCSVQRFGRLSRLHERGLSLPFSRLPQRAQKNTLHTWPWSWPQRSGLSLHYQGVVLSPL